MQEVGKRLKALRESLGLSQVKMAEALGSTQSSINRYENGQSTPPVALFRRYADYFDVSLDYIFARTDKPQGITYASVSYTHLTSPSGAGSEWILLSLSSMHASSETVRTHFDRV